ncbi:MAG: hypothetical protein OXK74_14255 [Gemmatimonadota bacterium]|nr:hypothetical protein [Gemmatimonadota bacterium]
MEGWASCTSFSSSWLAEKQASRRETPEYRLHSSSMASTTRRKTGSAS